MSDENNMEESALAAMLDQLASSNRRQRQEAARLLAAVAETNPDRLLEYADDLIDALDRPEAQTRWEILDVLTAMASVDASSVAGAFDGAETSLFDDTSAAVRLSAFRFLARFGSTGEDASDRVWPLLDEAIQCYHGDPEYRDMLAALLEFCGGNISPVTREALVARVAFDAENGVGYIKAYSSEIVAAAGE
ncbi:MAG: hypothetical protein J6D54_09325 [Olsenella sp.]|nr:hypothetical protein [Olsenella sp.]